MERKQKKKGRGEAWKGHLFLEREGNATAPNTFGVAGIYSEERSAMVALETKVMTKQR